MYFMCFQMYLYKQIYINKKNGAGLLWKDFQSSQISQIISEEEKASNTEFNRTF